MGQQKYKYIIFKESALHNYNIQTFTYIVLCLLDGHELIPYSTHTGRKYIFNTCYEGTMLFGLNL